MACKTPRQTDCVSAHVATCRTVTCQTVTCQTVTCQTVTCQTAACLTARRMDYSSAYPSLLHVGLLVPSARWLTRPFHLPVACPSGCRMDCSSVSSSILHVSGKLPDGLSDRSLTGVLVPSARSAACLTARRTDRSSAYLFLPLVDGLPDASLDR
jgi:hypothetical protein